MAIDLEVGSDIRGIRKALDRIADALDSVVAGPAMPEEIPSACQHPADKRMDFGMTDGVEDWQCGACGYRTVTPVEGQI